MDINQMIRGKLDRFATNFSLQVDENKISLFSQPQAQNIVVFSHLRWEFVKQRPQHLLERLAKNGRILFFEEPIHFSEKDRGTAHVFEPSKNVTIIQPRIGGDSLIEELTPIVKNILNEYGIEKPLLWFYSAAFSDIIQNLSYSAIVYDCMDELTAFKNAPSQLILQEKHLLKHADIVFTGGKSLYESKKEHHDNVYCFPSSVDKKHFDKSLLKATPIPADLKEIPHPRVGFYGVIDERIDLELLNSTADACKGISFIMIGPVVKINPEDLPVRPNIHYLGSKKYSELPNYLKGFDIAWMPFALNEATKFISPTKTLEFMAAQKPIISTPIYDVVRDYNNVVKIVQTPTEIKKAIQYYIKETAVQKAQRIKMMKAICKKTSWDVTANSMKNIMQESIQQKIALSQIKNEIKNLAYPSVPSMAS